MPTAEQKNEPTLKRLDQSHLKLIESWFEDPDCERWIDLPTVKLIDHIQSQMDYHAWLVLDTDCVVGYVLCEVERAQKTAGICLVVNPSMRRRGYGRRILDLLKGRPEFKIADHLVADIDPDNAASIACFISAGFREAEAKTGEGALVRFVWPVAGVWEEAEEAKTSLPVSVIPGSS